MITVEVGLNIKEACYQIAVQRAATSADATALVRAAIDSASAFRESYLWVRVTGDTTAASCRHHPLSPGTAGDPRR